MTGHAKQAALMATGMSSCAAADAVDQKQSSAAHILIALLAKDVIRKQCTVTLANSRTCYLHGWPTILVPRSIAAVGVHMTEAVGPVCFMQALLIIDSFGVPGQGLAMSLDMQRKFLFVCCRLYFAK